MTEVWKIFDREGRSLYSQVKLSPEYRQTYVMGKKNYPRNPICWFFAWSTLAEAWDNFGRQVAHPTWELWHCHADNVKPVKDIAFVGHQDLFIPYWRGDDIHPAWISEAKPGCIACDNITLIGRKIRIYTK